MVDIDGPLLSKNLEACSVLQRYLNLDIQVCALEAELFFLTNGKRGTSARGHKVIDFWINRT